MAIQNVCADSNCSNGDLGVLLGNGDGTFQQPSIYHHTQVGIQYSSIAVGDVNGDGKPDLIATLACGNYCERTDVIGVLLSNGDGTFQPFTLFSSGGYHALSVALGDVNRDGKLDVTVANWCVDSTNCNGTGPSSVGVLINISPSLYRATVQPPINSDGSSIFKANRGVIPVKFCPHEGRYAHLRLTRSHNRCNKNCGRDTRFG